LLLVALLVVSVVAMIKATDLVLESELKDNKDLVKFMTNTIAITLQGHHDLNTARRRAMKNDLKKDYNALCSSSPVDQTYETFPSWQKTSQMQTDSPKKCVPWPHRLVTAGIEVIVLAVEKYTDNTITTTAMLPIGEETIFFMQEPLSSGRKKEGTTNKQ